MTRTSRWTLPIFAALQDLTRLDNSFVISKRDWTHFDCRTTSVRNELKITPRPEGKNELSSGGPDVANNKTEHAVLAQCVVVPDD
ncbi:Uncharacterized protein APZ42_018720 [Daphnia magna]|uniref:Uncharacterized protein n=1 Tax=Daphnia magna TaxID=35525 RepID=A0A164YSG6_9CRUS|nr:Uncharacterized protein APZ42_018720 [Daphnia magna]